jgi:hypothetical protein
VSSALRVAPVLALLAACQAPTPVPTGAHLTQASGDHQLGDVGRALAIGASVKVTNATDDPVAGVPIGCQIIAGGGSVSPDQTLSGADGVATCANWVLGPKSGFNQLQVYANGLDPVPFSAVAIDGPPAFPITLGTPSSGIVHTPLDVLVDVMDTNTPTIVATFAGVSSQLQEISQSGPHSLFHGELDLSGVELGTTDALVVTASDPHFGIAETGALLTLDQPPELVVTSPGATVAFSRPNQVLLSATATGAGDIDLTAFSNGKLLARGTNIVLENVDLSAADNQIDGIVFIATDRFGATTTVNRFIAVSSNPGVAPAALAEGTLLDFDGQRALRTVGEQLLIDDFSQGSEMTATSFNSLAGLATNGAVLCDTAASFGLSLTMVGDATFVPNGCNELTVAGSYAASIDPSGFPWLADLTKNKLYRLSSAPVPGHLALTSAGDTVFNDDNYQVVQAGPDGVPHVLPLNVSNASYRTAPVTDGHLVAYLLCDPSKCPSLGVWDGTTEHVITPNGVPSAVAVNNGWLAWTDTALSGPQELWVQHWPDAAVQLAPALDDVRIVGLLPNGTVLAFSHQRLWRVPVAGAPEAFFTPFPDDTFRFVQRNGHGYFLFEGLALEVLP